MTCLHLTLGTLAAIELLDAGFLQEFRTALPLFTTGLAPKLYSVAKMSRSDWDGALRVIIRA